MLVGSFSSSINNRLKSTPSDDPCFRTFAGNTMPAMRTPILASMTNPDFRYTPEPGCSPFRIITAVAIQAPPLSFRSALWKRSAPRASRLGRAQTQSARCPSLADEDARGPSWAMVWRRTCWTGLRTRSSSLSGNSALRVFRLPMLSYGPPRPRPRPSLSTAPLLEQNRTELCHDRIEWAQ